MRRERALEHWDALVIETHGFRADNIYRYRAPAGKNYSAGFWFSVDRAHPFACDNAVNYAEPTLHRLLSQAPIGIRIHQRAIDIQCHAPQSLIPMPPTTPNGGVRWAKDVLAHSLRQSVQGWDRVWMTQRGFLEPPYDGILTSLPPTGIGELIAAVLRSSLSSMR